MRANAALDEVAPLENYDRIENWSDSASTSESTFNSMSTSVSTSESSAGSSSTSGSDSSSASESMSELNDISAYDASTLVQDASNNRVAGTSTNGTTYTTQGNAQNSNGTSYQTQGSIENSHGTNYSTHGGRTHGNIGVTTTAAMYKEWYQVLTNVGNIYDVVATVFLQSFVIPII